LRLSVAQKSNNVKTLYGRNGRAADQVELGSAEMMLVVQEDMV